MRRLTPLPWVKSWTASLTDFDWLSLSLEDRAVFHELVKLAAVGPTRGVIKGTDAAIAAGLRADTAVVIAAIDRLSAKPHRSVKRFSGGVKVVNWDRYQAPAMALSHAQRGDQPPRDKREIRSDEEQARHPLLEGYDSWVARPGDAARLDALAKRYPTLNLTEELADWMAYADRRVGEGKAFIDYIAAFSNRLKSQFEYYKKRGWLPEVVSEDLTADQVRDRMRIVS